MAVELPRLGVYLADTLAAPNAAAPAGPLGFITQGIQDERREANRIKTEQPILAIIGNPPYRRLKRGETDTLVGRWMNELWDDLKAPVRDARMGNQLNTFPELSVAFWRWSMWKLFESENAPKRGVIAFITNRKYLTGWPYAGLRKMLRERFDHIDIVDLRGDGRVGARADITDDQNVFQIRVGVCVTIAVADGTKEAGQFAAVRYFDTWEQGLESRQQKLTMLTEGIDGLDGGWFVTIDRDELANLRPKPFPDLEGAELSECFEFRLGGVQTARDELVYDSSETRLLSRVQDFLHLAVPEAKKIFKPTRRRTVADALAQPFDAAHARRLAFRPLDNRVLYADHHFVEYIRPELVSAWGGHNQCLYAMPFGTGRGPTVWCHGLLPDYQSFSERGGYAFPLYDEREGPNSSNVSGELLQGLSGAYGYAISPTDAFDAVLALLSASSYSLRFAKDLEDVFPHVSFPAAYEIFRRAVAIGREIRAVETFARQPEDHFRPPQLARQSNHLTGEPIVPVTYADGEITLCADGSGLLTGIPHEVWEFAVSGYRILPRWIEGRIGLPADLVFVRELRDVAARIAELIHRFDEADLVLQATLANSLTREELGFGEPQVEPAEEGDGGD